ncbi:ComEC/Rec2 family competence protein [Shimia haliotis]|uniref:Competence protein ComEC n=1 Tax=Shimia haliotis TaxID=1280847 RepID=A0A1I4AP27_9RHOB|nr:ComEC/Rec2 family competence protein [Shimia haliotis]SFK58225.1 competence protein ComEC [Shimia haliotis]
MRFLSQFRTALLEQHGHLFNWVPVCLGGGIGLYFLLRFEPPVLGLWGAGGAAAAMMVLARGRSPDMAAALLCLALVSGGFAIAGARAHLVAEPVLTFRYYGPVEGRVAGIDRSSSGAVRLTLEEVVLERIAPQATPHRVRVSLHGGPVGTNPKPGMLVGTTAFLSPPNGPAEPGGFDFKRHAWFQQLGAIGYSRVPLVALHPDLVANPVFAFRMRLSSGIQARMPPEVAGFAAAVTTGDRSAIPEDVLEALRIANLAHLLAISGLHMGLLAAVIFAGVRLGLAMVPALGLRLNGKKVAAVAGLVASGCYLLLSGGNVSTQRAFVMTAVMLVAILLDRRALSLRAVAVAATLVLLLRPESLLGPGFQMSFAATTALVAVFGALRDRQIGLGPKWARPVSAVFLSSLVAGLATAPFAALHFNHLAHYGLPANLLSVPVMGTVVAPSAVMAAVLAPLGLEAFPLWVMSKGLAWIQGVARFFSALDGARSFVVSPMGAVLPIQTLGAVWLVLWRNAARWIGAAVVCLAVGLWARTERPDVLISQSGGLVGVALANGRALSKPKGDGFVARVWLENDGVKPDQESASRLWKKKGNPIRPTSVGKNGVLFHLSGKRALAAFTGCDANDILVMTQKSPRKWPCKTFDREFLDQHGSVAISFEGDTAKITTAREVSGQRLWHRPLTPQD